MGRGWELVGIGGNWWEGEMVMEGWRGESWQREERGMVEKDGIPWIDVGLTRYINFSYHLLLDHPPPQGYPIAITTPETGLRGVDEKGHI